MPVKFSSEQNKNQKLLRLYSLLMFSKNEYSLSRLATILNCSKQTILRYIHDLEMSVKATIERTYGEDGQAYYRMTGISTKPNVSLTPDHIQHLMMCHDLLTNLLPGGLAKEIGDIIGHTTVLLKDFGDREKAFSSVFSAKPAEGKIDYNHHEHILSTLTKAISERTICNLAYESSLDGSTVNLSVAPLQLFSYRDGLYLKVRKMEWKDRGLVYLSIGRMTGTFVPSPEEIEVLAIHRISEVELTDTAFEAESGNKKDDTYDVFGLALEQPFRVKIAFSPLVASYIRQRQWSSDQQIKEKPGGSITLTMTAGNRDEIFSWLLSFGLQAQILEPKDLRCQMRSHAEELQRLYAGSNDWQS